MVGCFMPRMSPRSFLTSYLVSDIDNEVVCPLRNQDGSSCHKRCLGEKRYRSMQEHIRRAHPENYIPKLPATEKSFQLMISTPTSNHLQSNGKSDTPQTNFGNEKKIILNENSRSPNTPIKTSKPLEEHQTTPKIQTISAGAPLSHLHTHKLDPESEFERGWLSDTDAHKQTILHSRECYDKNIGNYETKSDTFSPLKRRGELLPSIFATPPLERSSTLPPIQRNPSLNRPRKESLSKRARDPQHKRNKSRGENNQLWRMSFERKPQSTMLSNGLSVALGKRWEDLIDAATSATKDNDEEKLSHSRSVMEPRIKKPDESHITSLPSLNRTTLPVFSTSHPNNQKYQASPLQQTLTPLLNSQGIPEVVRFTESAETVEDRSCESIGSSNSSRNLPSRPIQICCASCHGLSLLMQSYVCTECICGLCEACVDALMVNYGARRKCPKCETIGGRYKKINIDISGDVKFGPPHRRVFAAGDLSVTKCHCDCSWVEYAPAQVDQEYRPCVEWVSTGKTLHPSRDMCLGNLTLVCTLCARTRSNTMSSPGVFSKLHLAPSDISRSGNNNRAECRSTVDIIEETRGGVFQLQVSSAFKIYGYLKLERNHCAGHEIL